MVVDHYTISRGGEAEISCEICGLSDDDSNLRGEPVVETFEVSNTFAKLG